MSSLKDSNIKSRTYDFFDDMINIKALMQIKSRQMKGHSKIFLFTTLDN